MMGEVLSNAPGKIAENNSKNSKNKGKDRSQEYIIKKNNG